MKLLFIAIIILLNLTSLALASECSEKRSSFEEYKNRMKKLSSLKKRNEAAYNKTTNSLKKIKISSNLIIISNKSKKVKIELEKITMKFRHCFVEDT